MRFTWYFDANTTLKGNLEFPAQASHKLVTTKQGTGGASSGLIVWEGSVTSPNALFWEYLYGTYQFKGPISVTSFQPGTADASGVCGRAELYSSESQIGSILVNNTAVVCCGANVLGGAKLCVQGGGSGCQGRYNLNGYDQTVSALGIYSAMSSRITKAFTGAAVDSPDEAATLTIIGRGDGACDTNNLAIAGHVALTLNASGYRQVFTTRQNTTDGDITVKNGTLELINESSFTNVAKLAVEAGGTLLVNSTTPGLFGSVTNLSVDGTLTCQDGTVNPFPTNVVLALTTAASVTFPASSTITVAGLTLNGEPVTGEISAGDSRLPQLKGGNIIVQSASVETSDTWTGKGDGNSIDLADNWQKAASPDFLSGKFSATFAAADAESLTASVDCNVRFTGMTFSTLDGFSFLTDGSLRVFDIGADGLTVAAAESEHQPVVAFGVPVNAAAAQTWNIGDGATVRVQGGSTVPSAGDAVAALQKTGLGTLEVSGQNVWDGQVSVTAGDIFVSGTITTSSGPDSIQITGGDDAKCWEKSNALYLHLAAGGMLSLSNAVIEKATMIQFANDSNYRASTAMAGTTNTFNSYFRTVDAAGQTFTFGKDAAIVFAGGGWINYGFGVKGPGTAFFRTKPFTASSNGSKGVYVNNGARAVFEVAGNTIVGLSAGLAGGSGGYLDFKVDDVLTASGRPIELQAASTVNVFGTTQHFSSIVATASEFTGAEGSWIVVTNGIASTMTKSYFSGAVSYCHASTNTITFSNAASTSSGTLEVRSGTVTFAADASWLAVSNVVVTGTGRLVLSAGDGGSNHKTFERTAELLLDESGVLSIPTGVTQRFHRVLVGEEEIADGRYTYATAPAALKAHLDPDAGGTLSVASESGLIFVIQ